MGGKNIRLQDFSFILHLHSATCYFFVCTHFFKTITLSPLHQTQSQFTHSSHSSSHLTSSPGLDQFDGWLALKTGGQQGDFPHRIGQPHCQFFPQKHVGGFFTCIFPAWLNKRQEQVIFLFSDDAPVESLYA